MAESRAVCAGLRARREGRALWLTLDRPEAKNALTGNMVRALLDEVRRADADPTLNVVALTGTGDAFCAGADLVAANRVDVGDRAGAPPFAALREGMRTGADELIRAVWTSDVPFVAVVNGVAAGLGANLALVADVVVARGSARFGQVFVKRALSPDSGAAWLLPRTVGTARAKRLLLFGDWISGDEALSLGMIAFAPADDEFHAVAEGVVSRLASGPRFAQAMAKRLVNRGLEEPLAANLETEILAQELTIRHPDFREGVRAWTERREPVFGPHQDPE